MQRIIGSLLAVALWLTVWLSPLLLAMATGCMLVWAVQGDDYLVMHFRTVLLTAGAVGLLPALWLTERVRRRYGVLNFYAMLMNNEELNSTGSRPASHKSGAICYCIGLRFHFCLSVLSTCHLG